MTGKHWAVLTNVTRFSDAVSRGGGGGGGGGGISSVQLTSVGMSPSLSCPVSSLVCLSGWVASTTKSNAASILSGNRLQEDDVSFTKHVQSSAELRRWKDAVHNLRSREKHSDGLCQCRRFCPGRVRAQDSRSVGGGCSGHRSSRDWLRPSDWLAVAIGPLWEPGPNRAPPDPLVTYRLHVRVMALNPVREKSAQKLLKLNFTLGNQFR